MCGFIGREDYLNELEGFYSGSTVRACAVIGRRRIGKSRLLREFVKDKRHLYIQFLNSAISDNMGHISSAMSEFLGKEVCYGNPEQFFRDLSREARREKTVIVFDEYTYMSEADGSFSSRVQDLVDNGLGESMLIICGSSVSMMKKEVSDGSRPLFGRMRRIHVREMSLDECRGFHPGMSDADMLRLYMTVGGVPFYHIGSGSASYEDYIMQNFLSETGLYAEEGANMISCEFTPVKDYLSVLDSIPEGGTDAGSISARCGMDPSKCKNRIRDLEESGVVARINPMAGAPQKPVRFIIRDSMAAFHFQVLRKKGTEVRDPERQYHLMRPYISTFLGRRFEIFCIDALIRNYDVISAGKWWGKIPERDTEGRMIRGTDGRPVTASIDIDIVAKIRSGSNDVMLFSECKFTSVPAGFSVLNELANRVDRIKGDSNCRMAIISGAGFDSELITYAQESEDLLLIDCDMLTGKKPFPDIN